jgi:hypothetical protein
MLGGLLRSHIKPSRDIVEVYSPLELIFGVELDRPGPNSKS